MEINPNFNIGDFITTVESGLNTIRQQRSLLPNKELIDLVSEVLVLSGRFQALATVLLGQAEQTDAATEVNATDTRTWLADAHNLTRSQAGALVHQARDLARFPHLAGAYLDGVASPLQAQAVVGVLRKLPRDLSVSAERAAEETMVGYCAQFDSKQLATLSRHLLEVVAPEVVDESEAKRLERDHRSAQANRYLNFSSDGHGSTLIRGSFPTLDAELLQAQVMAIAAQQHRTLLDARDPLAETVSPAMSRADALVELARQAALHKDAPRNGGDRPRIMVTIDHQQLLTDCTQANLLATGEELSAGQLRQLACDAEILPIVMSGPSQVLDLGQSRRLVDANQRAALHLRDRGCVFPECDAPPTWCEAHHIVPWQQGGPTNLDNLALLCRKHHRLIEPDPKHSPEQQWQARIGSNGYCQIIPPRRVDPKGVPRLHPRYTLNKQHE